MLKKILTNLGWIVVMLILGMIIRTVYFQITSNHDTNMSTNMVFTTNLINTKGNAQNLSQFHDKIIVLNFWATWCPPCREEMPELSLLHEEYQHKNLVVLGIAIDEPDLVNRFLQSSPVSYPVFVATSAEMDFSSQLGNDKDVLPYTVIINADGNVVKSYFGRINKALIEATIKPLLAQ